MSWHGEVGAWFAGNWSALADVAVAGAVGFFTWRLVAIERQRDQSRLEVTRFTRVGTGYDLEVVNRGQAAVSIEKVIVSLLRTPQGDIPRQMRFKRLGGQIEDYIGGPPLQGGERAMFKLGFMRGTPEGADPNLARVEVRAVDGQAVTRFCDGDESNGPIELLQ